MAKHVRQSTNKPTRKLTTATAGGVAGVHIVEWVANGLLNLDMPQLVAADIAILVAGGVAWFVRNRA